MTGEGSMIMHGPFQEILAGVKGMAIKDDVSIFRWGRKIAGGPLSELPQRKGWRPCRDWTRSLERICSSLSLCSECFGMPNT
jgi:hypothetical protein